MNKVTLVKVLMVFCNLSMAQAKRVADAVYETFRFEGDIPSLEVSRALRLSKLLTEWLCTECAHDRLRRCRICEGPFPDGDDGLCAYCRGDGVYVSYHPIVVKCRGCGRHCDTKLYRRDRDDLGPVDQVRYTGFANFVCPECGCVIAERGEVISGIVSDGDSIPF